MDPGRRVPQGHPAPPDLLARRVTPGPAPLVRIAFAAETTKFWLVLFARTVRPTELSGHDAASVDLVHVDFVSPAGRRLRVQGKAASKMVLPTLHFRTFAGPLQTLRDSPGQLGACGPGWLGGRPGRWQGPRRCAVAPPRLMAPPPLWLAAPGGIVSGYRSVSQASFSSAGGIAREMKSNRRSLLGYSSRVIAHHPTDRCQLTAKELLPQTEQVTGQMATWREWRAWRREF